MGREWGGGEGFGGGKGGWGRGGGEREGTCIKGPAKEYDLRRIKPLLFPPTLSRFQSAHSVPLGRDQSIFIITLTFSFSSSFFSLHFLC